MIAIASELFWLHVIKRISMIIAMYLKRWGKFSYSERNNTKNSMERPTQNKEK